MSEERAEMAVFLMQERHELLSGLDAMRLSAQQELGVIGQGSVNFLVVGSRFVQCGEELGGIFLQRAEFLVVLNIKRCGASHKPHRSKYSCQSSPAVLCGWSLKSNHTSWKAHCAH